MGITEDGLSGTCCRVGLPGAAEKYCVKILKRGTKVGSSVLKTRK